MKQFSLFAPIAAIFLLFSTKTFTQTVNLGAAESFAVFTAVGAFNNLGPTTVLGDIGTNAGVFSGFPPGVVVGQIHIADATSTQAAADVLAAYSFLQGLTCGVVLGTNLGGGQMLAPNIYCLGAASTLNGQLILDAGGDPSAIFIFQIDGALSTGTAAQVILVNGASTCNVYWQINGAFSLGPNSVFRGTAIANGAISLLENSSVIGRALSTAGAIDMHSNVVTISLPPTCNITGNASFCFGQSTTLCATAGLAGYMWSTGEVSQCVTVTAAGNYSVTVTNTEGCTSMCNITVTVNPLPPCNITGTPSFCTGGSTQLCATPNQSAYLWSNGATSDCITVNTGGLYSVTITNDLGCTSSCSQNVVANPLPVCSITGNPSFCSGGTTQLCATPGQASYLWNTGSISSCINVGQAGLYSVTITDANGCSSSCSQNVTVSQPPSCLVTGPSAICFGQTAQLCVAPGAASYLWNTGAVTNCIDVTLAGIYSVTVTNAAGCSATCDKMLSVNALPPCLITGDAVLCFGESTQLCAPGGLAAYIWSTGATGQCITVFLAGPYSVTITDVNGCTSNCSQNVIVNPLPVCNITGNPALCAGGSTELCATPGQASYLWSNGSTSSCITVNQPGTYGVTITDVNGCSSNCSQIVTANQPINCTITGNPTFCLGQSIQLCVPAGAMGYLWSNGAMTNCITVNQAGLYSVTISFAGGCTSTCNQLVTANQPPVCNITGGPNFCLGGSVQLCATPGQSSYLWSNGSVSNCILVNVAGIYSVTITAANGCTSSCSQTVSANQPPVCNITGGPSFCLGGSVQLCATPGQSSYLWSNGSVSDCILVNVAGIYSVTITAANGCTSSCSQTVSANQPPVCNITGGLTICPGQSTVLCVAAGFASYLWSNGSTVNCITVNLPGTYSVTITDANGCTSNCSATVMGGAMPSCQITGNPSICGGGSTQLCVPAGALSYLWSTGEITNCILVSLPGLYSVTVTFAGGCSSVCSQLVTQNPPPNCSITGNPSFCAGGSTQLCVTGTGTYLWSTGAITQCINVNLPGNYSVTVTGAGGCSSVCSQLVAQNPLPICTITGNGNICAGQFTQLCATGGGTYLWSNGSILNCINVSMPGLYSVTVTSTAGCTSVCSRTVTASPLPNCLITGGNLLCPNSTAELCTPPGAAAYLWNTGATTNCITINTPGIYAVTVTNSAGCTSMCSKTVIGDNVPPQISCPANLTIECNTNFLPPNTGNPTATDNCTQPPTIVFVDQIVAGNCPQNSTITRIFTATDANGNSATCSQTITIRDLTPPVLNCPPPATVDCNASNLPPNTGIPTVTDNCALLPTVVFLDQIMPGLCPRTFTILRRWTATDNCGNSTFCIQQINVQDNSVPTITCPSGLQFQCAGDVPPPNPALVSAADNCSTVNVTALADVITDLTCANRFNLKRTFRATDACGNSATCSQLISVFDNTKPVITFLNPILIPGTTFEEQCFGQDPNWEITTYGTGDVSATDNCGGAVAVTYSRVLEATGNCPIDGFIVKYRLTWTATDVCGNTTSATVFQELVDNIPPTITGVPFDVTVNCDEVPGQPIQIAALDECLCACVMVLTETALLPGCTNGQSIVRTWQATDRCGNMTTASQRITFIDNKGPELALNVNFDDDQILDFTCAEGFPEILGQLGELSIIDTSTCGGSFFVNFELKTEVAQNCKTAGFLEKRTFTWTASDDCGNESDFILTARLIDTELPVLSGVPTSLTCISDPMLDLIEVTDNCGSPSLEFHDMLVASPCGPGFATQRIYLGFDDCGNIGRDTVILLPNTGPGPVISFKNPTLKLMGVGEVLVIDCTGSGGNFSPFSAKDVQVVAACPIAATVVFTEKLLTTPGGGDCLTNGGITASLELIWTATDFCGNTAKLTLLANVVDKTGPVFTNLKPEMTIGCGAAMPVAAASDNCGAVAVSTIDSIVPGKCVFEYTVFRTVTATDPCGNSTTGKQIIHVGNGGGPSITGVEKTVCDNLELPIVTAFDACAGRSVPVTMVQDTVAMPCKDGLVIERVWSAVDSCGNVASVRQIIILNDLAPPKITVLPGSDIKVFLGEKCTKINLSDTETLLRLSLLDAFSIVVGDDCDEAVIPVFTIDTARADDCRASGFYERLTFKWVATDACGNASAISFCVETIDTIRPVFVEIMEKDSIVCVPLPPVPNITATDNLTAVTVVFTQTILPGGAPGVFIVTRRWVATDECGNTKVFEQRITWIPDTFLECTIVPPPAIECNSHGVMISVNVTGGLGGLTYFWEVVGDKCFIQTGQGNDSIKIYFGFTTVKVKVTITDRFGCTTMCMMELNCFLAAQKPPATFLDANAFDETEVEYRAEKLPVFTKPIEAFPNPATETLNLKFASAIETGVEISLTDLLGRVVYFQKTTAAEGENRERIDLLNIPAGRYWLQLKTAGERQLKSVVVLRD